MKKIMFSDAFCLTQAVLCGAKTMTRRVLKVPKTCNGKEVYSFNILTNSLGTQCVDLIDYGENALGSWKPHYEVGEVVAIAQPYKDIIERLPMYSNAILDEVGMPRKEFKAGWTNKMFVRADLMPHHIRITDVKIERLQDISDEDCTKEGVGAFLKVICEKASEEYKKKSDNIYWITGRGYDQSLSYCYNCARKEVEALNQEIGKGYEKYIIDGGWGVEDEHSCFCEKCGKSLLFYFCGNVDLELPNLDLRYESDLYILNQILSQDDEDAEKVIRYFAREAFASLIDKVSGKCTWENNSFVVAYSFKLID